jgi:hypothetical protein
MNELVLNVISEIEKFLIEQNFHLKDSNKFIQKETPYKRENHIVINSRQSRVPYEYIEITSTCSIYYKEVNILDKKIVSDFLNSYPIIAGSIGYFKENRSNYFSIKITNASEIGFVSQEIIKNIKEGAFNLFKMFPTLDSIIEAINLKEPFFKDYINPSLRTSIQIASMLYLIKGKDTAIKWFTDFAPNEKDKNVFLEKMKVNWK